MSARTYQGPALFSYGFRPFFLLGSIYPVSRSWCGCRCSWRVVAHDGVPAARLACHEMLYGFLPAVITGFLFTAIPNWTGRLPLREGR